MTLPQVTPSVWSLISLDIRKDMLKNIRTDICTCIHTYTLTFNHTYSRIYAQTYAEPYVLTYTLTYAKAYDLTYAEIYELHLSPSCYPKSAEFIIEHHVSFMQPLLPYCCYPCSCYPTPYWLHKSGHGLTRLKTVTETGEWKKKEKNIKIDYLFFMTWIFIK